MKITKIGHCCLLIEDNGSVILTDPGAWTTRQNEIKGIDIVLITHEHADHLHLSSLQEVLKNNPKAVVVSNSRVRELLSESNIEVAVLGHEQRQQFLNVELAGFGTEHANIYPSVANVMNTGFLIQNRFFYPGDAFPNPGLPVEILAMPMIGPWMKLAESIDWALKIKPKACIPVHDGMLNPREWIYRLPEQVLSAAGIKFDAIEPGKAIDYS